MAELEDKIAEIIKECATAESKWLGFDKGYGVEIDPYADKILALIKENNYVRLSDDQSLPEIPIWCSLDGKAICGATSVYAIAQQDMTDNDFRRVELNETTKD